MNVIFIILMDYSGRAFVEMWLYKEITEVYGANNSSS